MLSWLKSFFSQEEEAEEQTQNTTPSSAVTNPPSILMSSHNRGFSSRPPVPSKSEVLEKLQFKIRQVVEWDNRSLYLPYCDVDEEFLEGEILPQLANLHLGVVALSDNRLKRIPDSISMLQDLAYLDLNNNQIADIPATFKQLSNLKKVELRYNNLASLPLTLCELQGLTGLDLHGNSIDSLPTQFGDLVNLQFLSLSKNMLKTLPVSFEKLTNLTQLLLSSNTFTSLPAAICLLVRLKKLDVGYNLMETLPDRICLLQELETLILTHNKLKALPGSLGGIKSLRNLELAQNLLSFLPSPIGTLPLTSLCLNENPLLVSPPPVVAYGFDSKTVATRVSEYFAQLEKNGGTTMRRIRVVLMGDGMAGKTSLIRTMRQGHSSMTRVNERTMVVEISTLRLTAPSLKSVEQDVEFSCFDFGGQDEYRVTHQLFLGGERTLFFLVFPMDLDVSAKTVEDWIKSIIARAPYAVVRLIATKSDRCFPPSRKKQPSTDQKLLEKRKLSLFTLAHQAVHKWSLQMERAIKRMQESGVSDENARLKGLIEAVAKHRDGSRPLLRLPLTPEEVVDVSCLSYSSILDLEKRMCEWVADPLLFPTINDIVPLSWKWLVEEVEHLKVTEHKYSLVSTREIFDLVGQRCRFDTISELERGLWFLHVLGIVLYYNQAAGLRGIVFLRPQWAANVMKMIINHNHSRLLDVQVERTMYLRGKTQYAQDLADLQHAGKLWHRLIPVLLFLRIQELKTELGIL